MIKNNMFRGSASVLCAIFVAYCSITLAQGAGEDQPKEKPGKKGGTSGMRWEGIVVRSSMDKSTLTVRKPGTAQERSVAYDSSTQFTAQEHGSKKAMEVDPSNIKDGDRIIAVGTWDKDGVLHAKIISKRLTK